ncbi:hypothetical protein BKA70DRAFT_1450251 [Coprinopsis sp. MPI-PUGE-AT-0042]|nr:hypothetical protein BKA70DRAFT_1450251 [Coprinopsis sp. MPI-PUGE-AT-0042]
MVKIQSTKGRFCLTDYLLVHSQRAWGISIPEIVSVPSEGFHDNSIYVKNVIPILYSLLLRFASLHFPAAGSFSELPESTKYFPFPSVKRLSPRVYHHDHLSMNPPLQDLTRVFPNLQRLQLVDAQPIKVSHATVTEVHVDHIMGGFCSISRMLARFDSLTTHHITEQSALEPWLGS